MTRLEKLSAISQIVASSAVVISLIYVGMQVNLNTHATQSATNQSLYQMQQDFVLNGGPDFYDLKLRFSRSPESISAYDSLRWRGFLNVRLNLNEAAYSNRESGMIDDAMAQSWLNGLKDWACMPVAPAYWEDVKDEYLPSFAAAVDAAVELAEKTGCQP